MTTKKIAATIPKNQPVAARQPSPYHRLSALLNTVRCIAQYEDALCELTHELKRASALSERSNDELRELLEKIPAHDYLMDLDMARDIVAEPQRPKYESSTKALSQTARKLSAAPKNLRTTRGAKSKVRP